MTWNLKNCTDRLLKNAFVKENNFLAEAIWNQIKDIRESGEYSKI